MAQVDRRTVLRGAGVTMCLPWLESLSVFAATSSEPAFPKRFAVLFSPAYDRIKPLDLAKWLLESGLNVRMQLQLHKYVWDPQARGV